MSYPSLVQIETIVECTSNCKMCGMRKMTRSRGTMSWDLFQKVIHDCSEFDVSIVCPFINGEPLCDDRMISMLWYIKRELPRASIGWFTNGLLLSKRIITELAQIGTLERGIFNFGLHGGNSETYTQNTKVPWKDALEKLDLLVAVNTQLDTPFEIHVQMCDFSLTHDSIEDFRELCHQRGVQAHVCCFSNFGGLIHDEIGEAPFRDLEYMLCARSQTHIYVLWDGSVTTCCFDVNGVNTMGNVKEHTLREIWESDRYQTFRQLHCDGRFSEIPVCRDCNSNRFGG